MADKITIGIDADGGDITDDNGSHKLPIERIVSAATKAVHEDSSIEVVLYGNQTYLSLLLDDYYENISIVPSTEAYTDSFSGSRLKGTSLNLLATAIRHGDVDGGFSIGNTRHVVNEAMRIGRLPGVIKPALVAVGPHSKGFCVYADFGATSENIGGQAMDTMTYARGIDALARVAYQHGIMAAVYSKHCLGVSKPRLGVLSNGHEPGKGSDLANAIVQMFESRTDLDGLVEMCNVGYEDEPSCRIEPKHVFAGEADVVVVGGFTGNIYLKTGEAIASFVLNSLKLKTKSGSPLRKIKAWAAKSVLRELKSEVMEELNPSKYAGAFLLGMKGAVVKGHGDSSVNEIYHGIRRTVEYVQHDVSHLIADAIKKYR